MNVCAVLATARPEDLERVMGEINAHPGTAVEHHDTHGRMIVVIDAETTEEELERMRTVKETSGVISAELVCHYFDDEGQGFRDPAAIAEELMAEDPLQPRQSYYQRLKSLSNF